LTSLDPEEFEALLPQFESAWQEGLEEIDRKRKHPRRRERGGGRTGQLKRIEDKLLFILVYFKAYPLQEVQGILFGLSQTQANYWIHRLSPVLQAALDNEGQLPERDPSNLAEILEEYDSLDFMIDGTERRRQRPKDKEKQKECYSGKKKTHAVKNNVIANTDTRQVVYLSETVGGKTHDKKLCDQEQITFPANSILEKDTGYQGYEPEGVITLQPQKKTRGKPRSIEEKSLNTIISRVRIIVEHVISGIKRCRIVKDVFRNTKDGFDDLVMEIACGLHNFRNAHRHPVSTVSLLELAASAYYQ
jgi:hypothetical protein